MLRKIVLAGFMLGAFVSAGFAFGPADSCQKDSVKLSDGKMMYTRLYIPRNFSREYRYPLVLQMHGIGECGNNDSVQVNHEYMTHQWFMDSVKNKYKPFVLYPQCPSPSSTYEWGYFNSGTAAQKGQAALAAQAAVRMIDSLIKVYPIDTTRLYVGGLSWGGIGTEGIMVSYPGKFAAAFPCAGENYLNKDSVPASHIALMTTAPFWMWHGLADGTVPVKPDTLLASAVAKSGTPVVRFVTNWNLSTFAFTPQGVVTTDSLNKTIAAGANYLCTTIPSGNHNSGWQTCFYHPSFVPWLMSKSRVNGQNIFTWPAPGPKSMTAVNAMATPVVANRNLTVGRNAIHWQGVSRLPAHVALFSSRGSLVKRYAIGSSSGELKFSRLPAGVYMVALEAQGSADAARTMMVIAR